MSRLVVVAIVAVLIAACGAAPPTPASPSSTAADAPATTAPPVPTAPTPSPTIAPAATLTPTPTPTLPAGPLPRVAIVEQDGVRVKIELERNPMPAGEWTTLTAVVRNTGPNVMTWFHDGCAIAVSTWGRMDAIEWRPGAQQTGVAKAFKEEVLDLAYTSNPPRNPIVDFVPERWAGWGSVGCADVGIGDRLRPGEAIRQRYVWDGQAHLRWGPPPTGPVTLTGTFAYYWRGREEPEEGILDRKIRLTLDAWVTGGADETWLSPGEVVDAALADREFVDYLGTQQLRNGREGILWYRPELGLWEVGIVIWNDFPEPRLHLVLVDPHSGAIGDTVDRAWSEDADGFP